MECLKKYKPTEDYNSIKTAIISSLLSGETDFNWLDELYSDANELKIAINKLLSEVKDQQQIIAILRGKSAGIEGAFGPQFRVDNRVVDAETIEVYGEPINERKNQSLGIRGSFISESNIKSPTAAYGKMIDSFIKGVVEAVIYDPNKKVMRNPDFNNGEGTLLNRALYDYRIALMKSLWEKLHPGETREFNFSDEVDFTGAVGKLLTEYANRRSVVDPEGNGYAAYMTLKNFDTILDSEFKNIIRRKRKYEANGMLARDMYEFIGGRVKYNDVYGEETADASDYTGQLVKILLNYFKGKQYTETKNGTPVYVDTDQAIGFPAFCNLITRVKEWAESSVDPIVQGIVHGDVTADWSSLIDMYLRQNSLSLTTDELRTLRGIQISLMNNDSKELKEMFVNQAKKTVHCSYLTVKPMFDPSTKRIQLSTQLLDDKLINIRNLDVQSTIKNAVLRYRNNQNSFTKLKNDYGIEITNDTITFSTSGTPVIIKYELNEGKCNFTFPGNTYIDDNTTATLVRIILGQPLPKDVSSYLTTEKEKTSLFSIYAKALALTLIASDKTVTPTETDDYTKPIYFKDGIFVTWKYSDMFYSAANLLDKIYTTSDTAVVRNEDGNALPSYQILSAIYSVKEWIYHTKNPDRNIRSGVDYNDTKDANTPLKENVLYRDHSGPGREIKKQPIGRVFTRGDIVNDGVTKSSDDLTASEVFHSEFIENFYKRASKGLSLILQPITFSDKKTHFLIEYITDNIYIGDEHKTGMLLSDVVSMALNVDKDSRIVALSQMDSEIRYTRGMRVKRQLINVFKRFQKSLDIKDGWVVPNIDMSFSDIETNIKTINKILSKYNSISEIRNVFTKSDLEEALDIKQTKSGKFEINPLLRLEAELYLGNKTMYDNYMLSQKKAFAQSLLKAEYLFDETKDRSVSELIQKWKGSLDGGWFDDVARTMKAVRVFKKGTKEEVSQYDQTMIETLVDNPDYDVELHPVLEAYLKSDQLLSQSFVELLAGSTNSFTGKYKPIPYDNFTDDSQKIKAYIEYTASNLSDEFKRTVLAGSVKTTYAQGKKYGVSSKFKMSNVADVLGNTYNLLGNITKSDAVQDGASLVSSYISKQENESLREASVGEGVKKTFINYLDPETGVLREIKHAEFTITNEKRRASRLAENIHYKMHNLTISPIKLADFDISRFYNLNDFEYKDDFSLLTHTEKVFYKCRKDSANGHKAFSHYRIDSVSTTKRGIQTFVDIMETEVDAYGNEIKQNGKSINLTRRVQINSIYDLESVFGGAYCERKDERAKKLVYSDANIDIVNNIICEYDLKDDLIAFVVNSSAQKVGAVNVNESNSFEQENIDKPLKYFEIESRYAGVVMNADHEIDEASVSEMTQMMSGISQAGFGKKTIEYIYKMIGRLAAKNIAKYANVKDSNDEIYLKIGKLFAKNFVGGNDSIGLAEAFVINAARELDLNITETKIPFSSAQIKGIYQATITSTLNKLGIRRKFSGFGGINSPSYGIMRTYNINGEILSRDAAEEKIHNELQRKKANGEVALSWDYNNVFWKQRSDINSSVIDNPYIKPILTKAELLKVNPEDTVVIRKKGELGDGKVITIHDIRELDRVKNFYSKDYDIYKWTIQPRELRQSLDTIDIEDASGKTIKINLCDLDTVRASFFLSNWDDSDPNHLDRIKVIKRGLAGSDFIDNKTGKFTQDITNEDVRKRALLWTQNSTQELLRKIGSGPVNINLPLSCEGCGLTGTVILKNYNKVKAQVITGKNNASKLGLLPGDTLVDIQRSNFFKDRLTNKFDFPTHQEYNRNLYDAIMFMPQGNPILIVFENVRTSIDRLHGCMPNRDYVSNSDGMIEKDGVELFPSGGKTFLKSADGNYDILVVDDFSALQSVLDAKQHTMLRYNYNSDNWYKIVKFIHPESFKNGIQVSNISINDDFVIKPEDKDVSGNYLLLMKEEERSFERRIKRLAERQRYAFDAQLNYILTRIPAQSMQSFMDVKVTLLTDSELNEVYVPRALTFINGSDYKKNLVFIIL